MADKTLMETLIRHDAEALRPCGEILRPYLSSGMGSNWMLDLDDVDMVAGQTKERLRPLRPISFHELNLQRNEPNERVFRVRVRADVQFWIEDRFARLFPPRGGSENLLPAEVFSPNGKSRIVEIDMEMELTICTVLHIVVCTRIFSLESPFHAPFPRQDVDCNA
jgi:hypothetical protein